MNTAETIQNIKKFLKPKNIEERKLEYEESLENSIINLSASIATARLISNEIIPIQSMPAPDPLSFCYLSYEYGH